MGTFTTNALPWSHFPTFSCLPNIVIEQASYILRFVRSQHGSISSTHVVDYSILLGKDVPPRVESVNAM